YRHFVGGHRDGAGADRRGGGGADAGRLRRCRGRAPEGEGALLGARGRRGDPGRRGAPGEGERVTLAAIVLAAGASSRMGRPKALLPWGDRTLLEHELATLDEAGVTEVVVVIGRHAQQIRRALGAGHGFVFNPR